MLKLVLLLTQLTAVLLFSAFFGSLYANAKENSIKIATLDYPPFIYQNGDIKTGILLEIVTEAFDRLSVNVDIEFFPITRGLKMVKEGEVDAYFSLKKTPERNATLLFTTMPLVQQRFVIFTLVDSNITYKGDINDLAIYNIGVSCNTSYGPIFDTAVRNGILKNIDCAQSFELNIKKLLAGRTDIIINSQDVGYALLSRLGKKKQVKLIEPPIEVLNSYLAFTRVRDYSALAGAFDDALCDMINDGTVNNIKSKYPDNISIGY
ncbi:substrate-binding periplasmic protein [Shewanella psychrotolerans]|uniref:substrate-binding periplasmic protein n=1 Tax=Shewanella psychrotolerans TaxID=2864206 RepID=UPI001C65E0C4|nr:transporter substrate-binding domain-containing protein [Shewanella psychrotolerans]QYK00707.1 transporter substrate-binding domain-containing protein [Shewanella psychrotolerans]